MFKQINSHFLLFWIVHTAGGGPAANAGDLPPLRKANIEIMLLAPLPRPSGPRLRGAPNFFKTIFKSETVTPVGRMSFFFAFSIFIVFIVLIIYKIDESNILLYLLAFCLLFIGSVIMGSTSLISHHQKTIGK